MLGPKRDLTDLDTRFLNVLYSILPSAFFYQFSISIIYLKIWSAVMNCL
jgi:hypothetical protein